MEASSTKQMWATAVIYKKTIRSKQSIVQGVKIRPIWTQSYDFDLQRQRSKYLPTTQLIGSLVRFEIETL
jgi:hypothetical protein